jgi:hypothetical protein
MNKIAQPIKIAMLAAALMFTLPAFAAKTFTGNQSAKQMPVSKKPSATSQKGAKEPVAHTTTITGAAPPAK